MNDLIEFAGAHIPQIAGTLIMAAVGAYFAEFNSRRSRLATAAEKFRNTVSNELKGLYPPGSSWPESGADTVFRLQAAFPQLQIAAKEFRHFLPWCTRIFFDRRWNIYRCGKSRANEDEQDYFQYVAHISTTIIKGKQVIEDNTPHYKDNFKRNVEKLLKYAKHT